MVLIDKVLSLLGFEVLNMFSKYTRSCIESFLVLLLLLPSLLLVQELGIILIGKCDFGSVLSLSTVSSLF